MPSVQTVASIEAKLVAGDFAAALTIDLCMRRAVRVFVQDLVFRRSRVSGHIFYLSTYLSF